MFLNHLLPFQILGYADYVFTSMFTFEILMKVTEGQVAVCDN